MVKKTTTRSATGTTTTLGYVVNDEELLDEILGECEKKDKKGGAGGKKNLPKQQKPPAKTAPAVEKKDAVVEEESSQDEDVYEVEKILEKRLVGKRLQYLVKWEGYGIEQATWEPVSNLSNVKNIVKEFEIGLEMSQSVQCQSTNTSNSAQPSAPSKKKTLVGAGPPISQQSKQISKPTAGLRHGRGQQLPKPEAVQQQQAAPQRSELDEHLAKLAQQKQQILEEQRKIEEEQSRMLKQIEEQEKAAQAASNLQKESEQPNNKVKQLFTQRKKTTAAPVKQAVPPPAPQIATPAPVVESVPSPKKKPTLGVGHKQLGFLKKKLPVPPKKADPPVNTPLQVPITPGCFDMGDIPEKVIGAKMSNGAIMVTLDWKLRPDGTKPFESIFTNEVVKDKFPRLLVDFYESRINAKTRPSQPDSQQMQQSA